jgi:hypothetical protein
MHVVKGESVSIEEMEKRITEQIKKHLESKGWIPFKKNEMAVLRRVTPDQITRLAEQMVGLNEALLNGWDVFSICEKEPRGNLDTGLHYYSVWYMKDNYRNQFWAGDLHFLAHQDANTRNNGVPYLCFYSGAIGMSRLLDATDALFCFLKSLTGTYAQL